MWVLESHRNFMHDVQTLNSLFKGIRLWISCCRQSFPLFVFGAEHYIRHKGNRNWCCDDTRWKSLSWLLSFVHLQNCEVYIYTRRGCCFVFFFSFCVDISLTIFAGYILPSSSRTMFKTYLTFFSNTQNAGKIELANLRISRISSFLWWATATPAEETLWLALYFISL